MLLLSTVPVPQTKINYEKAYKKGVEEVVKKNCTAMNDVKLSLSFYS
jgi:hypothetical protein